MRELVDLLLATPATRPACPGVADWLPLWTAAQHEHASRGPFDAAMAAAGRADRFAWAFFSGYQGALQAAFPGLARPGTPNALCVNEAGRAITAIATSVERRGEGLILRGEKSWTLAGVDSLTLFVLTRVVGGPEKGPGSLTMLRLPVDTPGVHRHEARPQGVVPELGHAGVRFDDVTVPASAELAGDGYGDHAKPFRLREDVFVTGAALAHLLAEARAGGWPTAWCQRAIAAIASLGACAALDPRAAATHVVTAGALSFAGEVLTESDALWTAAQQEAHGRWQRDQPLLALGKDARRQRAMKAWDGRGWGPN